MSSDGSTEANRMMECLKNHNASPSCLSDSFSSRSGTKCSHSRPSHSEHSRTMTSSRRQVADNSSHERRPSRTGSLDDYHSLYYRRGSCSPVHSSSALRR